MSGSKIVAIVIVALVHAALGYAFVTGLAFQYVKKVAKDLNAFDVEEPPPPPPDEPPPPPPDQPMQPPPVVTPPPLVQVQTQAPPMQVTPIIPPAAPVVPVAAPVLPPKPVVSQAAAFKFSDIQKQFGDPSNYPEDALDAQAQGLVVVSLAIDATGKVSNCTVTTSSRNSSLDAQTCRLYRRLKGTPARNVAGEAIPSNLSLRFRWQLPAE